MIDYDGKLTITESIITEVDTQEEEGWMMATSKRASPKPTKEPVATVTTSPTKRLSPNGQRKSTRLHTTTGYNTRKHDKG
jgi:hypothetical protein